MMTRTLHHLGADIGEATAGIVRNASSSFILDLNATGTDPILTSTALELLANGDATFSGELSAASGTFSGTVSAGAIIAADDFTAADAQFSGTISLMHATVGILYADADMQITTASDIDIDCPTGRLTITANEIYVGSEGPVSFGANDSGGSGYKVLRVPN